MNPAISGVTSANASRPAEEVGRSATMSSGEKVAELSRQFEALLLRQMLKEARKPMLGDTLTGKSSVSKIYDDMVTEDFPVSVSPSIGLRASFSICRRSRASNWRESSATFSPEDIVADRPTSSAGRLALAEVTAEIGGIMGRVAEPAVRWID